MRLKSMQNSPLRLRPLQKGKRRRLQHRNLLHPPRRPLQLALYRRRDYQRWAGITLVKAALSKICFDVQQNNAAKAQPNRGMRKMEKTFLFSDVFVVILSLGLVSGCQASRQGFCRFIWRKIVLRISDCDQGPDPGWQSNAVQCLQTGACGIWSDDEPRFCQGNARAPSRSHSAI
jgi:hypothetical protein